MMLLFLSCIISFNTFHSNKTERLSSFTINLLRKFNNYKKKLSQTNHSNKQNLKKPDFAKIQYIDKSKIPNHAKIHYNVISQDIMIPLFSKFRFETVEWHDRNYSYNVYGMLIFKIILIDFFTNLEKLCDNLQIINKSEIIKQLLQ